jgi:hypothetical protein
MAPPLPDAPPVDVTPPAPLDPLDPPVAFVTAGPPTVPPQPGSTATMARAETETETSRVLMVNTVRIS